METTIVYWVFLVADVLKEEELMGCWKERLRFSASLLLVPSQLLFLSCKPQIMQ